MSTVADSFNANYDRNILLFIFTATAAVVLLVAVLVATTATSGSWFFLPGSWWVGGMMVWYLGYRKEHLKRK